MSDPATTLDRLVAKAGQLYSLPAVAMKVLELTNNPQVDTRVLKECIENDPALTGKILRVVNSSLFGLSGEVSDLNQALALLGTKPLKLLVLGFSLPPELFAGVAGELLGRYWRHTLTKAVAGREISETLFRIPGDDAFIVGLLQDLGMLLLIQELGDPYVSFLEKAVASGSDLIALETESLGFDHTLLSARLLDNWGLPKTLVEAVAWNTVDGPASDSRGPEKTLPKTLHLAELFARLLADQQSTALHELLEAGQRYGDLTKDRLETLVVRLEEKVGHLAEILSLQLPEGLDYRDVLVQAHAQLAAVAAETAEDWLRREHGQPLQEEEQSLLTELRLLAEAAAEALKRPEKTADLAAFSSPVPGPASAARSSTAATPSQVAESLTAAADRGLLDRLEMAVAACRQARCSLSLLLVQLDDVDELTMTRGVEGFYRLREFLGTICAQVDHPCTICIPHGEAGFALILPDCERRLAIEVGNQLIHELRRQAPKSEGGKRQTVRIGVGVAAVAVPPKNFPAQNLFHGADRCLYGSHASGGSVVKSIEIY